MSLNNITKLLQQGMDGSFEYLYNCYDDCLKMKAETFVNNKNRLDLVKLDGWLHKDLPALIASRTPDPYIVHDELINIVKWKLLRTCVKNNNKNLKNLIIMNSPRLVMTETKKAFKVLHKKDNVQMALSYLTNLKGITLTTATLIISLYKPTYPYMSDECIESIPEIYSLNYTVTNYLALINLFKKINERLESPWSCTKLEHVIWIYQMLLVNKAYEVLLGVPEEQPVVKAGGPLEICSNGVGAEELAQDDSTSSETGVEDVADELAEDGAETADDVEAEMVAPQEIINDTIQGPTTPEEESSSELPLPEAPFQSGLEAQQVEAAEAHAHSEAHAPHSPSPPTKKPRVELDSEF